MAIIYSYPKKASPAGGDFLVITDSEQPAPNKNRTKSLTVGDLASFVISSQSAITGSGTINTVPIFTGSTSIGDSLLTYNGVDTFAFNSIVEFTPGSANQVKINNGNVNAFSITTQSPSSIAGIIDNTGSVGTPGQVLSSTGSNIQWVSDGGGTVTGTGTTNKIPRWSDGPNGVLGDSIVTQSGTTIIIAGNLSSGDSNSLSGNFSAAFGFNNTVTGNRSGGLGANNTVAGGQVWATGDGNDVGIDLLNEGGNIVTSCFNKKVK